jgi:hypothetical protein
VLAAAAAITQLPALLVHGSERTLTQSKEER